MVFWLLVIGIVSRRTGSSDDRDFRFVCSYRPLSPGICCKYMDITELLGHPEGMNTASRFMLQEAELQKALAEHCFNHKSKILNTNLDVIRASQQM